MALLEERVDKPMRERFALLASAPPECDMSVAATQAFARQLDEAAAIEARARHLGTPDLTMPAEDVARIVMTIIGGLAIDELIEPGSVQPELLGNALALVYAGLVAQAQRHAAS